MSKKKGKKKVGLSDKDFTINDSANAPKAISRVKKSVAPDVIPEKTWEDLGDDDFEIIEEVDGDGLKNFVYKKKKSYKQGEEFSTSDEGIVYPEIVWYLISPYIKPEDVGRFACINKTTYAITKRESFWRSLYRKYCQDNKNLPEKLMIENNNKIYGLRQRVIRGLYYTYEVFVHRTLQQTVHDAKPYELVSRRCVNVWYTRGQKYWYVYFKLKKCNLQRMKNKVDFFEELGRIDANPEEDSQVLQVVCKGFHEVPPLMGMTLSSVRLVLSRELGHHRLHLGFNSGSYNISRNIIPERSVVIDTVISTIVYDWWQPKYPHFENSLPLNRRDEESLPVLKENFFDVNNDL
ncbi:unnamed protein product [Danaus chrysippus]|uniref:(African queen) hypothetical protein n=1 Tax=Danaus chrysippus TaxID=151541 RepID=A0A8J2QGR0_9NEOP|nr:unnamed protein product [Danaus chrysippus]